MPNELSIEELELHTGSVLPRREELLVVTVCADANVGLSRCSGLTVSANVFAKAHL